MTSSEDELDIIMVSQLLPVNKFKLSSSQELALFGPPLILVDFFSAKHDTLTPTGNINYFKLYGAAASCNSLAVSFLHEYAPRQGMDLKADSLRMIVHSTERHPISNAD
jgi:hypothetical protein